VTFRPVRHDWAIDWVERSHVVRQGFTSRSVQDSKTEFEVGSQQSSIREVNENRHRKRTVQEIPTVYDPSLNAGPAVALLARDLDIQTLLSPWVMTEIATVLRRARRDLWRRSLDTCLLGTWTHNGSSLARNAFNAVGQTGDSLARHDRHRNNAVSHVFCKTGL
jgi:hypothetical protein